ncbi:HAD family hydrolase [Paenibacillus chungangensis]|uniref:HAD family hydrolase n=1 Tax=Paenibacillus chungangensis TaxID=696535 RepID=A0ABW3HQN4_9BACL
MIKAIIFDFDGTIIDTETPWYYAFRNAYEEHGVELSLEQYSECVGTSHHAFNPYEYLMTELNLPIDKEEFHRRIHNDHARLMEQQGIREGVLEYLEAAKAAGMRIGLASSSRRKWIDRYLSQLKLADCFEVICTADDVDQVKPDPALYKMAVKGLGVKPEEAVAIEDSPNGAKAAVAAGLACIIVPNALTNLLQFDEAERCKYGQSLMDIDFNEVAAGRF